MTAMRHTHTNLDEWPSSSDLVMHLRERHGVTSPTPEQNLLKQHRDLHAGYDTDPEITALAGVKKILDAELWVLSHWNELPEEHRFVILHALANQESLALATWRYER